EAAGASAEGSPRCCRCRHQPQAPRTADEPARAAAGQALRSGSEGHGDRTRGPRPRGPDPQVRSHSADQRPAEPARRAAGRGAEAHLGLAASAAKVDAFRTKKETLKATYNAAEAQSKIGEAFSGISEELGDVGMAVQRAEDKTASLQARAGAVDELLAS